MQESRIQTCKDHADLDKEAAPCYDILVLTNLPAYIELQDMFDSHAKTGHCTKQCAFDQATVLEDKLGLRVSVALLYLLKTASNEQHIMYYPQWRLTSQDEMCEKMSEPKSDLESLTLAVTPWYLAVCVKFNVNSETYLLPAE